MIYKTMWAISVALFLVIVLIAFDMLGNKSKNISPSQVYEIGKCYILDNEDPFAQPLYMKVIDKKNGYIKYSFGVGRSSSASERYLGEAYKEVDCKVMEVEISK